jgi:diguanylate cyclase (GGDEF)-like protein
LALSSTIPSPEPAPPVVDGVAELRLFALDGRPLLPSQDGRHSTGAVLTSSGAVVALDSQYQDVVGEQSAVALGADWPETLPPELRERVWAMLGELSGAEQVDDVLPCAGSRLRWLRVRIRKVQDFQGADLLLAQVDDLTEVDRGSPNTQLIRDPLTGLYNRRAFLGLAGLPADATARYVGVLAVDVRRFRRINDVWGRAVGDQCLVETARWLESISSERDVIIRLADAEFLLLLEHTSPAPAKIAITAQRTVRIGERNIQLSLQAGWAERTERGSLIAFADKAETALAAVKRESWRTVTHWTDAIAKHAAQDSAYEEAVQQAVAAGEEAVYFQPIVNVVTGQVTGVEGLARLGGAAAGVPTDRIIEASHTLGLTPTFAERIYDLALGDGLRLRSVFPGCLLGINVSREFLSTGMAIDTVLRAASRLELQLDEITLELTEDVAAGLSVELLFSELRRAADAGIQIVIDDFGRGETSLSLLRKLPLAAIKLDRSLLPVHEDDSRGWDFVEGAVSLLSKITGRIVAEGIETREQSYRLRQLGVYSQQGYLFSPPRPTEFWLENGPSLPGNS